MNTNKQPNEVERGSGRPAADASVQHNSVSQQKMSDLLAKKRHMSGMMCPPAGVLPWMLEQASKHD